MCTSPARLRMTNGICSWSVLSFLSIIPAAFFLAGGLVESESARGDDKPSKAAANSKSVTKSDAAEASADEVDADLDDYLSALVVPARFSAKVKEADKLKFSQELRGLLLEGFKDKGDRLEAARKHFETAHRLPIDDPRAAYSYGVVLLSQNKSAVALEQFRAAAKLKQVPFLPALQGVAWTNLSRGDYAQALPALLDLARRLEESQEAWPAPQDKEHSAEWLGRMLGFLEGPFLHAPGNTAEQAAQIKKLAADVAHVLAAERQQACERGRQAAAARYVELKAYAARPDDELVAEATQKRAEIVAAAALAEREAKLIEEELRDLKKPYDKQLADLSRQIHDNSMKIKTTVSRQSAAEDEVEELSAPKKHASIKSMGNSRRQTQQKVIRNENAGEKKIRESQLASAQKKLDNIMSSLEEAKHGVADAKKQREEAQVEYRKTTAPKRLALVAAQQKAAELATRARDAEHGALTPEKLKARATALEAYVPLYPELEKQRLLASLKVSP